MDRAERIESVRLLDVLQYTSHDDVVIIKIDVEGHECKVIVQLCLSLSLLCLSLSVLFFFVCLVCLFLSLSLKSGHKAT